MKIKQTVKLVERLFQQADKEVSHLKKATGLTCKSRCGACCLKKDIETTVAEFLPLAWHLFLTGKAEDTYSKLLLNDQDICLLYNPLTTNNFSGGCSAYAHRGLICRLFAFSGNKDRNGVSQLICCQIIKSDAAYHYEEASKWVKEGRKAPSMSAYYTRLNHISPGYGSRMLPINKAIKQALEQVLFANQCKKIRA